MKTYKVKITETLEKVVEVEAEDRDEAEQIVSDAWHNSEYISPSNSYFPNCSTYWNLFISIFFDLRERNKSRLENNF